ncbi:MAG: hypothetical protein IJ808_00515 [Muribaculaceae bacterium]|nr:hypothetical protein [Muribaculaceae bacterium]
MSFKQVNELRNNGQLQEALDVARRDYEENPADVWNTRSLFWALNDWAWQCAEQALTQQALDAVSQMEQLLPLMEETDEDAAISHDALHALQTGLVPLADEIEQAYRQVKEGHTYYAYQYITQLIAEDKVPPAKHETAAWILWSRLWKRRRQLSHLDLQRGFACYMKLDNVKRPSELHSRMLTLAVWALKAFPDFAFDDFLTFWGMNNFLPEDWQRKQVKEPNLMQFPSLVEQAVTGYVAAKKRYHSFDYDDNFMALLQQVIAAFPDDENLIRYRSLALRERGDKETALEMHRKLAMNTKKYCIWHELAKMLTHDWDLKKSALCQTLLVGSKQDSYMSEVHRELGWELAREGHMSEALYELEAYRAIRECNGRPLTWRYSQLRKRIPADVEPVDNNYDLYVEGAQPILDWVYKDLERKPAVLTQQFTDKHNRQLCRLQMPNGMTLIVRKTQLPADEKYMMVRCLEDNGKLKLISVTPADRNDVVPAFHDSVTGNVKIMQGKDNLTYGFVEGCFVPGRLLEGVRDGETITVLTEMQPDGRRRAVVML